MCVCVPVGWGRGRGWGWGSRGAFVNGGPGGELHVWTYMHSCVSIQACRH